MWLFVIFVAIPIIEIALFIQVGGVIGLIPTVLIVILTAIVGTTLLRQQGRQAMRDLQRSFSALSDPSEPLAHGAMILFAGALLLTPGFFTDVVGLSLMIPRVRAAAFQAIKSRVKTTQFTMHSQVYPEQPRDETVIDGEFEEMPPPKRPTHGPSGWTKH